MDNHRRETDKISAMFEAIMERFDNLPEAVRERMGFPVPPKPQ
jgi:hypothetical protein